MKLSVSLRQEDVEALDRYVEAAGLPSRSSAIQQAIRLLSDAELERAYMEAFGEWSGSEEAAAWESAGADGLADAAR